MSISKVQLVNQSLCDPFVGIGPTKGPTFMYAVVTVLRKVQRYVGNDDGEADRVWRNCVTERRRCWKPRRMRRGGGSVMYYHKEVV
jgi:hypothetical protein